MSRMRKPSPPAIAKHPANPVAGRRFLAQRDPALARAMEAVGPIRFGPPRPATLLQLSVAIIGQQLSVQVARVISGRFRDLLCHDGECRPEHLLALSETQLRQAGLSAAKARTVHALAAFWQEHDLSPEKVTALPDDALVELLTQVKGIGPWTVKMFLIFSLHRANVLPQEDLGLRAGIKKIYGLEEIPTQKESLEIGSKWSPHCTLATHYCWKILTL
jgi:DNA-3-methyladenine glycosylase II